MKTCHKCGRPRETVWTWLLLCAQMGTPFIPKSWRDQFYDNYRRRICDRPLSHMDAPADPPKTHRQGGTL